MLAVETDPDKKELYEAQLKVLELKLKEYGKMFTQLLDLRVQMELN